MEVNYQAKSEEEKPNKKDFKSMLLRMDLGNSSAFVHCCGKLGKLSIRISK